MLGSLPATTHFSLKRLTHRSVLSLVQPRIDPNAGTQACPARHSGLGVGCSALLGIEGVEHGLKKSLHILPICRRGLESITSGCIRLLKESILQEVFLLYLTLVSLQSVVVRFP